VGELALELHHYGPPRARASARRIAGVFRRAGLEVGAVPESVRGGLGHNMVLGASVSNTDPTPHQGTPARSAPLARAVVPQPASRKRHDSDTEILPTPPLPADPMTTAPHVPAAGPAPVAPTVVDPSSEQSGRWYAQPQLPPPSTPGAATALLPGAPPSGEQAYTSGEYPVSAESGRFHALAPSHAVPDGAPLRPRRAVTAQSWQNVMLPPDDGKKKLAFVVAGILVLLAVGVTLVLVRPVGTAETVGSPEPAAHAVTSEDEPGEPSDEGETEAAPTVDADAPSGAGGAAAEPATEKSAVPPPRPLPRPKTSVRPPRPPSGMYDHR
jgi:hypothetical protein